MGRNKYIGIVEYRYGTSKIMISNFDLFMVLLNDDSFTKKFFRFDFYNKLTKEQGSLENDECFGYVPLLVLGGTEKIENIKKVKLKEHILLMSEALGMI